MKLKTINMNITEKIAAFAGSIKNEALAAEVIANTVVTGGCIASMMLNEAVNDYDLYLTEVSTTLKLATYYALQMEESNGKKVQLRLTYHTWAAAVSAFEAEILRGNTLSQEGAGRGLIISSNAGILDCEAYQLAQVTQNLARVEIFVSSTGLAEDNADQHPESGDTEEKAYRPVFLSSNAITLSDKVQIILRFVGTPAEIHENYDFSHATNYWTQKTGVVINKEALESLLSRELTYRGSLYPLASIFRTRKFIERGWTIHVGSYVKMAMQLNELDLTDVQVLEDQLTGVDAAYLGQLIYVIKEKKKDDPNFKFNSLYVCELCDRMMGLRSEIEE